MSYLSDKIKEWYMDRKRDLPWRNTKSPYAIWLSEIILQQTRVNQGLPYYLRFMEKYPDIANLAAAHPDDILKLWQGLGYYSRARNMHATARTIMETCKGQFPSSYEKLLKLKGIGPYTAAAIASMAFDIPVAVVDGNVFRVLARLYHESTVINSSKGYEVFRKLAEGILDHEHPGLHNQALMELGSLICLPRNPLCHQCPLSTDCKACLTGRMHELPVKLTANPVRSRFFNYLFMASNNTSYLMRRVEKDIWKSLFEFPLIETPGPVSMKELIAGERWNMMMNGSSFEITHVSEVYRHQLTHQRILATFYRVRLAEDHHRSVEQWLAVEMDQLERFALPRLIERYLHDLKQRGEL